MTGPEIKNDIPVNTPPTSETNFDKLQKAYPDYKDKLNFLNDAKFTDVKESLSKTITDLAKENDDLIKKNVATKEDFWDNIQKVTEDVFSDPLFDFDAIAKTNQAENIYIFRTELENTKNKNKTITTKTETNTTKTETKEILTKIEALYTEDLPKITIDSKERNDYIQKDDIKKIKENDIFTSDPDTGNKYLLYRYTAEKLVEQSKTSEKKTISQANFNFITQFNKLDTDLNI